jgi:carbamoyl-phosphate synthase small subunit
MSTTRADGGVSVHDQAHSTPRHAPEAVLVCEDGTTLRGVGFGASGTAHGEVVFNTAMTGYQEVLTDPSYRRQLVCMAYPHQGNYGVTAVDAESDRVQAAGLITRAVSPVASNHRAEADLPGYLADAGVVGISGVDTRKLVRRIRDRGAMRAAVSTELTDPDALLAEVRAAPGMAGADLATTAGTTEAYDVAAEEPRFRVVVYDFGLKANQLRLLSAGGCALRVVPAETPAEEVLGAEADGVFVSNGPGDPSAVTGGIARVADVVAAGVPVFGICLGHQLLARALGAQTYKMTFGHRGVNQPVRNEARRAVEITSHNHGFAVDAATLPDAGPFGEVRQTHLNLNDDVNEGLAATDVPVFGVQYHPEAAPGPHDARYLFAEFTELMQRCRGAQKLRAGAAR